MIARKITRFVPAADRRVMFRRGEGSGHRRVVVVRRHRRRHDG